jgi:predicted enzyme related to lactoylglutathione lyase
MSSSADPSGRALLRPGNIVLGASDPRRLAEFWSALTGYVPRTLFGGYEGLRDPEGRGPHLTFQLDDSAGGAGHCHFDLYSRDPEADARRAQALGARRLREVSEGDVSWIVLADPDGNEFCLVAAVGPGRPV